MTRRTTRAAPQEWGFTPDLIQWQLEKLALVMQRARVWFCTPGISAADRRYLWSAAFEDPQRAVDTLCAELPKDATIAVIPEGPYVFSQLA